MHPAISPTDQAADARAKAAQAEGKERDYWLWLAGEWDKSVARHDPPAVASLRPPRRAEGEHDTLRAW